MNNKNKNLIYAYNIPLFLFITFIMTLCMYHLLSAYRDRDEIRKHKIDMAVKKTLYY